MNTDSIATHLFLLVLVSYVMFVFTASAVNPFVIKKSP